MPIVTISRGSYTRGREIAEKLSAKMKYELVSREVLIEASEQFNISEVKLERALHDPISVLDRFTNGRKRYYEYIRSALLKHLEKDNVVYHGLAGHAFIPNLNHLLRVRIRADIDDRVKRESERENISQEDARYLLTKDDEERRKWSIHITGHDPCEPSQYDIIFNASKIASDDIVDIIAQTLNKPYLQNNPESQKKLEELAKSTEIKAQLIHKYPSMDVSIKDQTAIIRVEADLEREETITRSIQEDIQKISDIKDVRVSLIPLVG